MCSVHALTVTTACKQELGESAWLSKALAQPVDVTAEGTPGKAWRDFVEMFVYRDLYLLMAACRAPRVAVAGYALQQGAPAAASLIAPEQCQCCFAPHSARSLNDGGAGLAGAGKSKADNSEAYAAGYFERLQDWARMQPTWVWDPSVADESFEAASTIRVVAQSHAPCLLAAGDGQDDDRRGDDIVSTLVRGAGEDPEYVLAGALAAQDAVRLAGFLGPASAPSLRITLVVPFLAQPRHSGRVLFHPALRALLWATLFWVGPYNRCKLCGVEGCVCSTAVLRQRGATGAGGGAGAGAGAGAALGLGPSAAASDGGDDGAGDDPTANALWSVPADHVRTP